MQLLRGGKYVWIVLLELRFLGWLIWSSLAEPCVQPRWLLCVGVAPLLLRWARGPSCQLVLSEGAWVRSGSYRESRRQEALLAAFLVCCADRSSSSYHPSVSVAALLGVRCLCFPCSLEPRFQCARVEESPRPALNIAMCADCLGRWLSLGFLDENDLVSTFAVLPVGTKGLILY